AQRSVLRVRDRSTAALCGTVTLPAAPTAVSDCSVAARSADDVRQERYTASRPSPWHAALNMSGESEWATGSPSTTSNRVLALTLTLRLGREAVCDRCDQTLQLTDGVPIHVEVAAEG